MYWNLSPHGFLSVHAVSAMKKHTTHPLKYETLEITLHRRTLLEWESLILSNNYHPSENEEAQY